MPRVVDMSTFRQADGHPVGCCARGEKLAALLDDPPAPDELLPPEPNEELLLPVPKVSSSMQPANNAVHKVATMNKSRGLWRLENGLVILVT